MKVNAFRPRAVVEPMESRTLLTGTDLGSFPHELTTVGGVAYFVANDGATGREVWRTDGTTAGTRLVRNIRPDPDPLWYRPEQLTAVGDRLFFIEQSEREGPPQLWTSDGASAGTVMLAQLAERDGYVTAVGAHGGKFYAAAKLFNERLTRLWVSDGTATGTRVIKEFRGGERLFEPPAFEVAEFQSFGPSMYFTLSEDGAFNEQELWKTDGTPAGTVLVRDFRSIPRTNNVEELTPVGDALFLFTGPVDMWEPARLWRTDGAAAGLTTLSDRIHGPRDLVESGGSVFFLASAEGAPERRRHQVWRSDGTPGGTAPLDAAIPGHALELMASGDGRTVYFTTASGPERDAGPDSYALWRTDGTPGGTVRLLDLPPTDPVALREIYLSATRDGRLFFTVRDWHGTGNELWTSDGTAAGTRLVADIDPGPADGFTPQYGLHGPNSRGVTLLGDALLFPANDGLVGTELWRASAGGASLVRDVRPQANRTPRARAGGPYALREGDALRLDASATFDPERDALTYEWMIAYDHPRHENYATERSIESLRVTGRQPVMTWEQIRPFVARPARGMWVFVRVRDAAGNLSVSPSVPLTVAEPGPYATVNYATAEAGAATIQVRVDFRSADPSNPIDLSGIVGNHDAVRVTGPGGYDAAARYVSHELYGTPAGASVSVVYEAPAPGGSVDAAGEGEYAVRIGAGEVRDAAGRAVFAGEIGRFSVNLPDPPPPPPPPPVLVAPTAASFSQFAPEEGGLQLRFQVTYEAGAALDPDVIRRAEVSLSGPGGYAARAEFARWVTPPSDGARPLTAGYAAPAPGGTLDPSDNGGYPVAVRFAPTDGGGGWDVVGVLTVEFAGPEAPAPPAVVAALQPVAPPAEGSSDVTFTIVYTADAPLERQTVEGWTARVFGPGTGPGWTDARLVGFADGPADPPNRRTAVYRAAPPGGSVDATDNGTYRVLVHLGALADGPPIAVAGQYAIDLRPPPVWTPPAAPPPAPPADGADLRVAVVGRPPAPGDGRPGRLSLVLSNTGNEPANGVAGLRAVLSADDVVDAGDVPLATLAGQRVNLKPGQSKRLNLRFAWPGDLPVGTYRVLAAVEPGTSVPETDARNNVAAGPALLLGRRPADLAVSQPSPAARGGRPRLSFTLSNLGGATARGTVGVQALIPRDPSTPGDDLALPDASRLRVNLKPGSAKTYRLTLRLPPGLAPETYELVLTLTPSGFDDADLSNNVVRTTVRVG